MMARQLLNLSTTITASGDLFIIIIIIHKGMVRSNVNRCAKAAARCLFIGGAVIFRLDSVHSFHAVPTTSLTRRCCRGKQAGMMTALGVKTLPSDTDADRIITTASDAKNDSYDVVDDLWANQEPTPSNGIMLQQQHQEEIIQIDEGSQEIIDTKQKEDSTRWILAGGTLMVLAAAGALAVSMGNDLGIDLELG